jgi:hypothetical protein
MTSHDPINPKARELFDRASERLDQGSAYRLQRARMAAQQPRRSRPGVILVPAGAFAAAVLALGLAWWTPESPVGPGVIDGGIAADAEIDALVDEDPELYAWLAEAPVAVMATGPRL